MPENEIPPVIRGDVYYTNKKLRLGLFVLVELFNDFKRLCRHLIKRAVLKGVT